MLRSSLKSPCRNLFFDTCISWSRSALNVSLFFSSKKEVNLSRPFFRKLSSCEHTWIWIYSMCHLYVMKHLPLAFEFQGLNSKLNSVVYLESRKVGSLKKCWAFKMAFTCTMYRFYFISLLLSGAFRIAKNWIHHQFLTIGFLASKFATIWQGANLLLTYLTLNDLRPPQSLKDIYLERSKSSSIFSSNCCFPILLLGHFALEAPSVQAVKSATTEEANFWLSLRAEEEEEPPRRGARTLRPLR